MKKIITLLSILTLGFGAFAQGLKPETTIVTEFSALTDNNSQKSYVEANYDSTFASYQAFIVSIEAGEQATQDEYKTKTYINARKALFGQMILFDYKKFIENTEGSKTEKALTIPLSLTSPLNKKAGKVFYKEWTDANMENIWAMWTVYIGSEEKPKLGVISTNLFKTYLTKNPSVLKTLSFSDVASIAPILWIKENKPSYIELKSVGFVIENIALDNSLIFNLAKSADDYAYISTMALKGLNGDALSSYVKYMKTKILALSDAEAYKATKTLESKLLALDSKQVTPLVKQVQSIQDVVYLRIMRDNKIK